MLLSIDPGLHACGLAIWADEGKLVHASLVACAEGSWADVATCVRNTVSWYGEPDAMTGCIELPQVYVHGKGDPNDLVQLAAVVGAVTASLGKSWKVYKPREWKGQIPKPKNGEPYIIEIRARKRLSAEELGHVVLPKSKKTQMDVWDSIGIGLHGLRRL